MRSITRSITSESCEVLENSNPTRNRDNSAEYNGNREPSSQSLMFLYRKISQSASVPPQPTLPPPIKVGNNYKEVVYSSLTRIMNKIKLRKTLAHVSIFRFTES